jgi:hypothetical protein
LALVAQEHLVEVMLVQIHQFLGLLQLLAVVVAVFVELMLVVLVGQVEVVALIVQEQQIKVVLELLDKVLLEEMV